MRGDRNDGPGDLGARIIKALAGLAAGAILLAFRNDVHEVWLRAILAVLAFVAAAFALLQLRSKRS